MFTNHTLSTAQPKSASQPVTNESVAQLLKQQAEAEQTIRDLQRQLEEQGMLIRMVVHDLRVPLAGILGYNELLKHGAFGAVTADQVEALQRIENSSLFMCRLINNLLTSTRNATHIERMAEHFDPILLAHEVIGMCAPQAQQQGLELVLECPDDLPQIVGDADSIREMLLNLLGNALRYTEQGRIYLSLSIIDGELEFRVIDSGPGISIEDQAKIWLPFMRATDHGEGQGLGLYTVQRLAKAMNGTVGVQSTVGIGSQFWFRLPYQEKSLAVGA